MLRTAEYAQRLECSDSRLLRGPVPNKKAGQTAGLSFETLYVKT